MLAFSVLGKFSSFFSFSFFRTVLIDSLSWSGTHCVGQADLEPRDIYLLLHL